MIRFVCVGAAHIDRVARIEGAAAFGQSNPARFDERPGGAALNVASNLSALGADVTLKSVLGDDAQAEHVRAALAARGLSLEATVTGQATATYTAILDDRGDLVIAIADMTAYDSASIFEFPASPDGDWLVIDANLPEAVIDESVASMPGSIAALTVSAAKAERMRAVLPRVDLLFTNRAEAAALNGLEATATLDCIAHGLMQAGARRALISDGANPLGVLDGAAFHTIAIPPVAMRDVTGAGDALAAGALLAVAQGETLDVAARRGIAAAQAILAVDGPFRPDLADAIGDRS